MVRGTAATNDKPSALQFSTADTLRRDWRIIRGLMFGAEEAEAADVTT
jgi:hypothetical protein